MLNDLLAPCHLGGHSVFCSPGGALEVSQAPAEGGGGGLPDEIVDGVAS